MSSAAQSVAVKAAEPAQTLVLLHGWGSDQRCWAPLLTYLQPHFHCLTVDLPGYLQEPQAQTVEEFLDNLMQRLPPQFTVLGWSLGGMLAVKLAVRYPQRVQGVITLAANACFVEREDWALAMAPDVFEAFRQGFQQSPESTLKRFAGLVAKNDGCERSLLNSLRVCSRDSFAAACGDWQAGLDWLHRLDNRRDFSRLKLPGLHLLGEQDVMVPAACAEELRRLNPQQRVELVANSGHGLHWSQPQLMAEKIHGFILYAEYQVAKTRVAASFSRAASTYDSAADLQRRVGGQLLQMMGSEAVDDCLDLGTGTGFFLKQLRTGCRRLWALDLAIGMLDYARHCYGDVADGWLCADAESLPLAADRIDRLFSAMVIQWCADLPRLFEEIHRVLKSGGQAHIATLGPATLKELRAAWSEVDGFVHVNHFAGCDELLAAAEGAGLSVAVCHRDVEVLRYDRLSELTAELKALGAHNMNRGQSSGLTGRQRLKRFQQAYEQFRGEDGCLTATYELYYLTLVKD